MNNIEGQDVRGEQGCCEGARVPDYQDNYVEDEVQNKANVIILTFTVMFLLKVMVNRKTSVFQRS